MHNFRVIRSKIWVRDVHMGFSDVVHSRCCTTMDDGAYGGDNHATHNRKQDSFKFQIPDGRYIGMIRGGGGGGGREDWSGA